MPRTATATARQSHRRANTAVQTSHGKTARQRPPLRENDEIPVSVPAKEPEALLGRSEMLERAEQWAKELTDFGVLEPDDKLIAPKQVYCSTGIGDFTKIATWAQWYGIELLSDLANIDRKRFALLTVEQYHEGYSFTYGLLHRDTGRIRHLFRLSVDEVGPRMRKQGLKIPDWFDVADLDHYRVG